MTQPLFVDRTGALRFKPNAIVRYLLDRGREHGVDMNHLATLDFADEITAGACVTRREEVAA